MPVVRKPSDLTTVANVKAWGRIASAADDALLARLVSEASIFFCDSCARDFTPNTYTEYRDGTGSNTMLMQNFPVTAIASLRINAIAIPQQVADGGVGWFLNQPEADTLTLVGYSFERGQRNVRITYTAGPLSVPFDVEQAVVELVLSAYKRGVRGPDLDSRSIGASGQSGSWHTDLPKKVQETIEYYLRRVPV